MAMSEAVVKKVLNFKQIVEARDRKFEDVEIPEWGGTVRIWQMTAEKALEFVNGMDTPEQKDLGYIRIVALCMGDEEGNPIVPEGGAEELKKKNGTIFARLQEIALRLNGFSKEAQEAAKNGSSEAVTVASPTV